MLKCFRICSNLFQIHEGVCGFGGGSLVNAGVLLPTPIRTRRDPRWPKDWNKDWEHFERLASSMLGAQVVPAESTNAQIEDYKPDPIKLSINFGRKEEEEEGHNLVGSKKLESCLACGNCLSGCPYTAKNSADKNYLALAVEDNFAGTNEHKVLNASNSYMHREKSEMLKGTVIHPG
ncbi:hypothetical protein IEQ34_002553 [Dendrobium chrysotoxum]|uniref:4Fe-4S ferredoxin-type domain-containing protein n=1 Tax=Dendrobium chrysotoxum TaxID=161865 RepID=A0AAV7HJW0_DENCH|nr:hypothetical protein IEQ34_002553 [Dendrobium chrysotoxum]